MNIIIPQRYEPARLSPNFTKEEFTRSEMATRKNIINVPNEIQWENIKYLCENVLEPLRAAVGPLYVSSGYRCPELNKRIGGASQSAHMCLGGDAAADIISPLMSVKELFAAAVSHGLRFDQVIEEFGEWVHIASTRTETPRGEIFFARKTPGGKTYYAKPEEKE